MSTLISKRAARELGAKGLEIPRAGLRSESFEWLTRRGDERLYPWDRGVPSLPITIAFYPDGKRAFVDGRHRVTLARQAGEHWVKGRLLGYGVRGGVRWMFDGWIPI